MSKLEQAARGACASNLINARLKPEIYNQQLERDWPMYLPMIRSALMMLRGFNEEIAEKGQMNIYHSESASAPSLGEMHDAFDEMILAILNEDDAK